MKFAVHTWQSEFKVDLHTRRIYKITTYRKVRQKKKGRRNISRQKLFSNLYQICCLGLGEPKFHYEYVTCVKDSQCLNRCLLDCTARKLRSPVFKILKVVTFKAKCCIPQYFRAPYLHNLNG